MNTSRNRIRRIRLVLIPIVAVAAVFVGGCASRGNQSPTASPTLADNGISALSANEISTRSLTALRGATSVHVVLEYGSGATFDIRSDGHNAAGLISNGATTFDVRLIGTDAYVKTDAQYYRQAGTPRGELLAATVGGKFAKMRPDEAEFQNQLSLVVPANLLEQTGTLSKGETKVVNGTPTIGINEGGGRYKTMYVATVGEALPIALTLNEPGTVTITYGEPVSILAPPPTEVVNFPPL